MANIRRCKNIHYVLASRDRALGGVGRRVVMRGSLWQAPSAYGSTFVVPENIYDVRASFTHMTAPLGGAGHRVVTRGSLWQAPPAYG